MHVEVTWDDITAGVIGNNTSCAIALALQRNGYTIWCDLTALVWIAKPNNPDLPSYYFPAEAMQWMGSFDKGDPVLPFTFELELQRSGSNARNRGNVRIS